MGFCNGTAGHALDDESGFCSYCGAKHSADGEAALPGCPAGDLDTGGTLQITPKLGNTVPMPAKPSHCCWLLRSSRPRPAQCAYSSNSVRFFPTEGALAAGLAPGPLRSW